MTPSRHSIAWAALLWLAGAFSARAADEWWSLQPLRRPPVPAFSTTTAPSAVNPIDAFVARKLAQLGLRPSPEAGRRTLLRRLHFDLIGLPPSPEETRRFLDDPDPKAYEKVVDALLSSPHYGERWARHWLDVVHYGDTHGYDKDQPRPNAWPYRDYVVRAFNDDKPYARFVQEQLAGDILFPGTADGIEALGFISAGPWDLIGHAEVPETKIDGKIARHLDRDDMVANTMSTFNSLTVHCAQCHNHKFDPITAEDYYSLQAVFAAVDRTNVEYYQQPGLNAQRARLKSNEREWLAKKKSLEETINRQGGPELAELQTRVNAAKKPRDGKTAPEFGYHSAIETSAEVPKWVQLDLGQTAIIERVVLAPCSDDFAGIGDGFGFPPRFKIEASNDPDFASGVALIHDQTHQDARNAGIVPQIFNASPAPAPARYLRVTATRLAPRQNDFIFALAELEIFDATGTNLARHASVTALDSIETPVRWTKKNLTDGIYPASKLKFSELDHAALQRELAGLLETKIEPGIRAALTEATNALASVQSELAAMPKPQVAFIGAVHHGSGSFRGTGPGGGKPRPIHLLARGDVRNPGKEVVPGALSAISELPSRFSSTGSDTERRRALALWLTDPRHPLTWRSIVNRVWHYHFGRGLVDTPNDFGRMGSKPSHPELLDWLAAEFRDSGQSFKHLHKLIVTSAAYRQISALTPGTAPNNEKDRDNQFLWRMNSRKIEAEALRDSVLFASGKLDTKMGGPAFQDFIIEKPEHSPHYQYHLHDPDDPKTHRRSIYRFIVRSQQQPFMTTLDCADPSMLVDKRNESLSALQALALLNNGFMVTMARHFAERLEREAATVEEQVETAFAHALSRPPSATEKADLAAFAQQHGLPNTCRLILNLNEFTFLD